MAKRADYYQQVLKESVFRSAGDHFVRGELKEEYFPAVYAFVREECKRLGTKEPVLLYRHDNPISDDPREWVRSFKSLDVMFLERYGDMPHYDAQGQIQPVQDLSPQSKALITERLQYHHRKEVISASGIFAIAAVTGTVGWLWQKIAGEADTQETLLGAALRHTVSLAAGTLTALGLLRWQHHRADAKLAEDPARAAAMADILTEPREGSSSLFSPLVDTVERVLGGDTEKRVQYFQEKAGQTGQKALEEDPHNRSDYRRMSLQSSKARGQMRRLLRENGLDPDVILNGHPEQVRERLERRAGDLLQHETVKSYLSQLAELEQLRTPAEQQALG